MEGKSDRPCASGSTVAAPLRTVATSEFVVPRSMPTARRRSCGTGDWPGSEIWKSAISAPRPTPSGIQRFVGCVDLFVELFQEHEFPHGPRRALIVMLAVDAFGNACFHGFLEGKQLFLQQA